MADSEEEALQEMALREAGVFPPERVVFPLCARCAERTEFFLHDDETSCPLCARTKSGSLTICEDCADQAGVCVFHLTPVDGSSDGPAPWLAELAPQPVKSDRRKRQGKQVLRRGRE